MKTEIGWVSGLTLVVCVLAVGFLLREWKFFVCTPKYPITTTPTATLVAPGERMKIYSLSHNYAYKWCRDHRWSAKVWADYISPDGEKRDLHCDGFARNIADNPGNYLDDWQRWKENH